MARRYAVLYLKDKERCLDQWRKNILQAYLEEIQVRANQLRHRQNKTNRCKTTAQINALAKNCEQSEIFGVYYRANRMLIAAGKGVEQLVGKETRSLLADECAKAVADVYDKRLYQLVKKHFYNRMK